MEIVTPIILLLLEVGGDSDGESEMLRPKFRSVQVLIKSLLLLWFETAAAREDEEDGWWRKDHRRWVAAATAVYWRWTWLA